MKEAGVEPKRKQFKIEAHFDDCGDDLAGLGKDFAILGADYVCGETEDFFPTANVTCPGCKGHYRKTHPLHNRNPDECKFPTVEAIDYRCLGCRQRQPAGHSNHNYLPGECSFGTDGEAGPRIAGQHRSGAAPREPSIRPARSPVADAQPQLPDGTDLAGDDEQQARDQAAMANEDRSATVGSEPTTSTQSRSGSNSHPEASNYRRRNDTPRSHATEKARYPEEVAGPEQQRDWTRFDIGSSLQVLRHGSYAACLRELRKLHLRWWHIAQKPFREILAAAGLPQKILEMSSDVVNTCRECRQWQQPGDATQTTSFLADRFNQRVESDILFVMQFMIYHLVDKCTRFHGGEVIEDKTESSLLSALWTSWINVHGPMEQLVIDGEAGLNSKRAKSTLKAEGIELITRAPQQHAHTAERSGQLLRLVIHLMIGQMVKEGITLPFKVVAGQALFAMNALFGKNGRTSYQCVYGRQPPMLPPIEGHCGKDSADGRQEQRVRQIAINSFVQASVLAQTQRALAGKSSSSGHKLYEPGDYVDYYRKGSDKDTSGWRGPVKVVSNSPHDGGVICRINNRDQPCRYQDIRHTLHLVFSTQLTYFSSNDERSRGKQLRTVLDYAEALANGTQQLFGTLYDSQTPKWVTTTALKQNHRLTAALHWVAQNVLFLNQVMAVRVARGVQRLTQLRGADYYYVYSWYPGDFRNVQILEHDNDRMNLHKALGAEWKDMVHLQIFIHDVHGRSMGTALNEAGIDAFSQQSGHDHNKAGSAPRPVGPHAGTHRRGRRGRLRRRRGQVSGNITLLV